MSLTDRERDLQEDMERLLNELNECWSFDNNQWHTHSWHDKQDFLERWRARAALTGGAKE